MIRGIHLQEPPDPPNKSLEEVYDAVTGNMSEVPNDLRFGFWSYIAFWVLWMLCNTSRHQTEHDFLASSHPRIT